MIQDNDAILTITPNGIKIKTPPKASIATNSSHTHMVNIEQESTGGNISHNSGDMTQIGGSQSAKNSGNITNRVNGGTLYQEDVNQSAEDHGTILNEVKKN